MHAARRVHNGLPEVFDINSRNRCIQEGGNEGTAIKRDTTWEENKGKTAGRTRWDIGRLLVPGFIESFKKLVDFWVNFIVTEVHNYLKIIYFIFLILELRRRC